MPVTIHPVRPDNAIANHPVQPQISILFAMKTDNPSLRALTTETAGKLNVL
jgi:hypothetical protein